jgi:hypothetical protein
MAISPNVNFSSGAVYTADQANRFPRGVMAYTSKATNFSLSTTMTDVGVSVTFTAVANRYYKYTAYCYAIDNSAAANITLSITESGNTSKGDAVMRCNGVAQYVFILNTYISTETAGTVVRKLRASAQTGSGVMYAPIWLLVEDIGPA